MNAIAVKRGRALAREHAPEVLVYCAVRAVGLIVLAAMAPRLGRVPSLLTKWDGQWYLGVAGHGYDTALTYRPSGGLVNTNIVFFPLYPLLIAGLGLALGAVAAALLISLLAGIAAAIALRAIGEELYDRRTGLLLAALWAAVPTAVVESMAYTESLYTALAAFTVLYLIRGRWIAAGVAALLAGLTHPTGVAAAAAVGVCALATLTRRPGGERAEERIEGTAEQPARRRPVGWRPVGWRPVGWRPVGWRPVGWRPWLACVLAPIGALSYLVWVAVALGRWDGFSYMEERGWNSTPSLVGVWHQITAGLTRPLQLGYRVPVYVLFATVALAAVLTVMLWRKRASGGLPVGAFAWASIVLGLFIGPGYFHAEARFLMPDFPVLLPPAVFLARRDARVAVAVVCGLALLSAWYGGYLLTEWTHSP